MTERSEKALRLGTRGSQLARWQAEWVAGKLQELGQAVELVLIRTRGDAEQSGPIAAIGAQGVFTKELQRALLEDRIDLAVHSMKDLPTVTVDGLTLAAVPPREAVQDALVSGSAASLDELQHGAVVGTGSTRRKAQLLAYRPDLQVRDLRGNVGTRLEKLDHGDYQAIVLAEAGLRRLGLAHRIAELIPLDRMLPAPAQGALAIECRADDPATVGVLTAINHPDSHAAVTAERATLRKLEGGCLAAMGAYAVVGKGVLSLRAVVLSPDGAARLFAEGEGPVAEAAVVGGQVALDLLNQGAADLLSARE